MNKPLIERLHLDESNLKTLIENKQKASAFMVFKTTFIGQLWNAVKTNWYFLIFCIPVAAWLLFSALPQANLDTKIGYSANIGGLLPINDYAYIMGLRADFVLKMQQSLIMLPLIVLAFAGLAGVFNVTKYHAWGMQIKIFKTFLRGIKNSYTSFIFMGVLLGVCYILINYFSFVFDVYSLPIGYKIAALTLTSLIAAFLLMLCVYVFPQAVMFDLSAFQLIKNALILSSKFVVQSLLIAVIGLLSMGLIFLTFNYLLQMIGLMLFFFMAFSFTACVWTSYTHSVFELVGSIKKTQAPPVQNPPKQQTKKARTSYQNPKKKKRS